MHMSEIVFLASPLAANYMRNDEKRAYGGVLAGGEASEAKVCNRKLCMHN